MNQELRIMVGRFNAKNPVRHYQSNSNSYRGGNRGTNSMTFKNNLLHVRDLPRDCRHGMAMYKAAVTKVQNRLANKKESWINDFDHFKQLNKQSYTMAGKETINKNIKTYLAKIEQYYKVENKKSHESLTAKIAKLDTEWIEMYGSVPDIKLEKSDKAVSYNEELKSIKHNHYPTIYSNPGTTNFDYLSNSIRLLASQQTICFSFDIEAYEKDNNILTEIGISIYDPRENIGSMVPITRNFHIIISESLSLRNQNWVCDLKECYLSGQSLVLNLNQCVEFVQSLINYYMVPTSKESETWSRAYVGHNIDGDFRWLTKIGVNIPNQDKLNYNLDMHSQTFKGVPYVLDTMKLYRFSYGQNGSSLGKILRLFGLPHAFLHNAGNDAHYTLKLLMHMCDINFRTQYGLDDIDKFQRRAQNYLDRSKIEPKILPMSYSIIMRDASRTTKPKKDLVPQTEFGGTKWFSDAHSAFESTIEYTGKLF